MISQSIPSSIDIPSGISSCHHLIAPASLSMAAKIAGQLCITFIKILMNKPSSIVALTGAAFEDVCFPFVNILNGRELKNT
jgi:hypothetical protein